MLRHGKGYKVFCPRAASQVKGRDAVVEGGVCRHFRSLPFARPSGMVSLPRI
jgi:hypothetical protein